MTAKFGLAGLQLCGVGPALGASHGMVRVTSETGRLRRVLVHEPGPEVDLMVPSMMQELLFDDILFGDRAREEHGRLRRLLQILGVEVIEANRLLEETLACEEARGWLERILVPEAGPELRAVFEADDPAKLARALVVGERLEGGAGPEPGGLFRVPPLPNWCFQRDPQIVVHDGVVFSAMATQARWREALLSRAVFRYHPAFAGTAVLYDPLRLEAERPLFLGLQRPMLEGGDLLVLSPELVAVGLSERTNRAAVTGLMRGLARREGGPRWLLAVPLPARRAFMHLDTVFTPVDRDAALVHWPIIEGAEQIEVYEADLQSGEPALRHVGPLLSALRRQGLDLEPLPCGGDDPVAQQREQWTDGANAFALSPGVVLLYDRNVHTAQMLARRGFSVIAADDVLLGRCELDLDAAGRTCLLLASNEIARARGGPHCLTHPLVRDET